MLVRPLAAFRSRPIHKTVVRKSFGAEVLSLLTEGEALSVMSKKGRLRVLKEAADEAERACPHEPEKGAGGG